MTAADTILGKALVGSKLDTQKWSKIQAGLRDRAFFSAKVEEARILHAARQMCAEVAEGKRSASEFRRDMRALLEKMGHPGNDGNDNDLRNLYAQRRLDVLRETNVRQARGYVQHLEATTQGALMAFPAQELVRVQDREKPRDWETRWRAAGGHFYGGRMIALKGDPIWAAISRFGTPWPPFDFGSGMGVEDIDREEAVELGVIGEDDPPPSQDTVDFNAGLEAEVEFDDVSKEWSDLKKTFGDQIQLVGGKVEWRGEVIRENFEKGGNFTMRLGEASSGLMDAMGAKAETRDLAKALEGQGQLVVTQGWLDRKRKDGSDHRAHFGFLPDHPDSKPLTTGDLELIPSIWRNPDRVFNAGGGCIGLEMDSIDGDLFRMIVQVTGESGTKREKPNLKTFYRATQSRVQSNTAAAVGPPGALRPRRLNGATAEGIETRPGEKGKAE